MAKGFALPIDLTTVFKPLTKVIEGKDVKFLKWENKCGLLEMWLDASKSRTLGPRYEDWEI